MRNFDAVIFDMDGLMVDTENMIHRKLNEILGEMGFQAEREMLISLIGLPDSQTKATLEQTFGETFQHDLFLKKLRERKKIMYQNEEIAVKKGLWELLEYLKKQNIKNIVATSSPRENMNLILKKTDILKYFDLSVCGDEIERGKPFPDIFLKAVEKLNVPAERCLILEDSQNGIIAAKEAGIPVIFIKDLVTPEKQYMDTIYAQCNDLSEVITYLK